MCGIVGFAGKVPAAPVLLKGLAKLEYRGYDSAGIAVVENGTVAVSKAKGKIKNLSKLMNGGAIYTAPVGIGHTRWATHGKPSDRNAHPHVSSDGRFAVVHNGIIENYAELKAALKKEGVHFASDTDTEVVAHLICKNYKGDLRKAVIATINQLEGSYALGVICNDHPEELVAVRRAMPLIVGLSKQGNFIASDITAMLEYTRTVYYLADDEVAAVTADEVKIYDMNLIEIQKEVSHVNWDISAAEKGGYEHFMIKEIMEQPEALHATIAPRIDSDGVVLDGITITKEELERVSRINIVACGSSYHVGMVGKYIIEQAVRIPVTVDLASEFRYANPLVDANSLVIVISQSGETADTLAALREAKAKGARVLAVVNVVGSSIANEADDVLYTWAGPEISVATTKAYSTQLAMMYLIALYIAQTLGKFSKEQLRHLLAALMALPGKVEEILKTAPALERLAQRYAYLEHAYFIGRNFDYAVALEASLKLKEISYIHSEAYAAGELKHGTISLIEDGTFVVALACCEHVKSKTYSNIEEVKARGAEVLLVTTQSAETARVNGIVDHVISIPATDQIFMPTLEVVPMQLLGYYIAKARKCDVDQPRNLAKSVTVE